MSNFIKERVNDFRCHVALRNFFEPNKEFLQKTRVLFLSRMGGEVVTKIEFQRIHTRETLWRYAFSVILITFFLGGGVVIYADTQNVNVGHPLYQIKRTGEKIQFVFSSPSREPFLYQKFAKRRLIEIKVVETTTAKVRPEMLDELNLDLSRMIYLALEDTMNPAFPQSDIIGICREMIDAMKEYDYTLPQESFVLQHIKDHCREFMTENDLAELVSK